MTQTAGIHHVTAISGPARRTLETFTRALGLRLVKRTVNFDDPATHHFYFGDAAGAPGTLFTVFPWASAAPGRVGVGETQETAFRVPAASIGYWSHRLLEFGLAPETPEKRFGETALPFRDPDGMRMALVGVPGAEREPALADGPVGPEHAIRGIKAVTLLVEAAEPTGRVLTEVLGFEARGTEGSVTRFASGAGVGGVVDLRAVGGFPPGRLGAGSVHHVAFRAADDAGQARMVERLRRDFGIATTEQKDRAYFRSVYFREPGRVLFEIATDVPGFTVDESPDALGSGLRLPAFLEPRRAQIERMLPAIDR